jgi:hypothetical protein
MRPTEIAYGSGSGCGGFGFGDFADEEAEGAIGGF